MKERNIIVIITWILITVFAIVLIAQAASSGGKEKISKYQLVQGNYLRAHVIGDYGEVEKSYRLPNGEWHVEWVAAGMRNLADIRPISMVISVGDNIYNQPEGSFDNRNFKLMHEIFDQGSISMKPWYVVLGNHDCMSDISDELDMTKLYPNWNMPAPYWNTTVSIGNDMKLGLIYLNSCEIACEVPDLYPYLQGECESMKVHATESKVNKQYAWLEQVLIDLNKDTTIAWIAVVMHMPIFSASVEHGDNDQLKKRLYPILFKYNVDLVLTGHDHQMEYLASKKNSEPTPFQPSVNVTGLKCGYMEYIPDQREFDFDKGDYIHNIIMGAGGASIDEICPDRVTDMADLIYGNTKNYGFMELYVDPSIISINFYEYNSTEPIFTSNIHNYNATTSSEEFKIF
ncbi:unnamed protein product [Blepharisma stoltei]|uniref:Calcineurin-like phosphoesterase domain-containing protein n=1 Tax=Blepharisma stoltei TaxID=1481888 RepID=A0AAU9KSF3_9CILI|nr:unnamed protein product [Blepharisma stoltei]